MFNYAAYLHFADSISATTMEKRKIAFDCKFCGTTIKCVLGETSNVKSHLNVN